MHTLGYSWALGWIRLGWNGRPLIGHDGNTIGQSAFLRILPNKGLAVVLLTIRGAPGTCTRTYTGSSSPSSAARICRCRWRRRVTGNGGHNPAPRPVRAGQRAVCTRQRERTDRHSAARSPGPWRFSADPGANHGVQTGSRRAGPVRAARAARAAVKPGDVLPVADRREVRALRGAGHAEGEPISAAIAAADQRECRP